MPDLVQPLIIARLKELSDYDFQNRVWLASTGPEISSFTEAVSGLFDDSGLGDALEKCTQVFSSDIDLLFRTLDKELHDINERRPPEAIITDPRMARVRTISASLLALIEKAKRE